MTTRRDALDLATTWAHKATDRLTELEAGPTTATGRQYLTECRETALMWATIASLLPEGTGRG